MREVIENIIEVAGQIYQLPLAAVAGIIIGIFVLWLVFSGLKNLMFILIWKIFNRVIVVLSIIGIISCTIMSRGYSKRVCMLIPFYSFVWAMENNEVYRSMVMNMLLFFPFGLSFPFAVPRGVKHKVGLTVLTAAVGSTLIEILQYCFCLGRCETDDVIMNTLGAMIGAMVYMIRERISVKVSKRQVC